MDNLTPVGGTDNDNTPFLHTKKGLVVFGFAVGIPSFGLGWFARGWRADIAAKRAELEAEERAHALAVGV